MNRRGFLEGILALGMAPAIVRAEILMPVRQLILPPPISAGGGILTIDMITREALRIAHEKMTSPNLVIGHQYDDAYVKSGIKIGNTLRIRIPKRMQ